MQMLELKGHVGLLLQQRDRAPFPPAFRLEKAVHGFSCPVSGGCWARRDEGQDARPKPPCLTGRQTPVPIGNKGLDYAETDGNNIIQSTANARELKKRQMELHEN